VAESEFQPSQYLPNLQTYLWLTERSFCNLWSLRPSFGRVSLRGVVDTLQGQEAVKTSAGPFAHCPEDLDLFMKAYSAAEPWKSDPVVVDMPWRHNHNQYPERLCFAIAYGSEAVGRLAISR
jgi:Asp-tRNA(Asn)/Glu-tRNA(Gln) amidotransferase A subunit family amidase